jgi:hypothetical protein
MRNFAYAALPLLLALALIPSVASVSSGCFADFDRFYCTAYTDKPFYSPGDTGKLTIDLKNLNNYTIRINNLTITFPWAAYVNGQWDGNTTIAPNANITHNSWMQEQNVPFTVPSDGRFPSSVFGSTGTILFRYTSYCPNCGPDGRYQETATSFGITPNSFLVSTGWTNISNYLLFSDILLATIAVLILIYILWSRPRGMARVTPV